MEMSGQRHAPAALPPGKNPALNEWETAWPQSRSGRFRKDLLPLQGFEPRIVQPIVRSPPTISRLRSHRIIIQKTTALMILNMCTKFTDLRETVQCEFNSDYSAQGI